MDSYVTVTGNTASVPHFAGNLNSWLKFCDRCFTSTTSKAHSVSLFSSSQKMFLTNALRDLFFISYFFWDISSSPESLLVL